MLSKANFYAISIVDKVFFEYEIMYFLLFLKLNAIKNLDSREKYI
jgi:hypothetical protein